MWKESILKLLKLDGLVSNLTGYIETRVELVKLEVKEDIAKAMARLTVLVVVIAVLSLFILFFSVSIALLIGEYLGFFEGFAIVAGFYLLITILFVVLRGSVSEALEKKLVEKIGRK
jgi:uncharacterized membrane protein YqjE